ncbi:hypothetical protein [Brevundimonas sp. FT23028]|uniref:hypothetical protein n=1 Tax=Brevundimonas sp. FT23028 TaxID=3393748 RepID=UPI003B5874D1
MKKFDLERLKGKKVVVNCKTEEQAQAFINWVASLGKEKPYNNRWLEHQEDTCCYLNSDLTCQYLPKEWFRKYRYEIISFKEALLKEDKKQNKKDKKISKLNKENKEIKEKLTNANQAVKVLVNTGEKLNKYIETLEKQLEQLEQQDKAIARKDEQFLWLTKSLSR